MQKCTLLFPVVPVMLALIRRKPYLFGNHRMLDAAHVNKTVPFSVEVIVDSGQFEACQKS